MQTGFMISEIILRCQAQAVYHPENIGHFGLALDKYAHFTSPIRRYADLIVHRSLIKAYDLGEGELSEVETVKMFEIADHISATERTSAESERNAVDRFTAAYLKDKIGMEFIGRISGVTRFGLFIKLKDTGADGLVPIRSLPSDYYVHDEANHALVGKRTGRVFRLGAPVLVSILEADPITASTVFELVNGEEGAEVAGYKSKGNSQPSFARKDFGKKGKPDRKGQSSKKFGDKKKGDKKKSEKRDDRPPQPQKKKKPHRKGPPKPPSHRDD
jgi:ribonuclease R